MAEPRTVVGKKVKRLRAEGKVPAVVYGPGLKETVQVSVEDREFSRFYQQHGHATLFDLQCDGQSWPVFIRDVQVDPVRRNPVHVDFFSPNLKKVTTASVPLALTNVPAGPGIFSQLLSEVVVTGLPANIPQRVTVDCSGLQEIGDAIRVADLEAFEGIEYVTAADEMVAMLAAPVIEVEPTEELEEGEAAEADAEAAAQEPAAEEDDE